MSAVDITRFAPSPTGFLHIGHAAAALFARARGRRFLLRLEDIDPGRCRPEFAAAIVEDLAWIGLAWDGAVRVQSEHLPEYAAALERLREAGLLYPCFCTRADVVREATAAAAAPHGPDGAPLYPGTCRGLAPADVADRIAASVPHAWRLDMARAAARTGPLSFHEEGAGRLPCNPAAFGDVILGRRDAPASYHLCVTHDDAAQGVTLVTRGHDLMPATSVHRMLQTLLGWPEPGYAHHLLLHDANGKRMSKRRGSPTLRALREQGVGCEAVMALAQTPPFLFLTGGRP